MESSNLEAWANQASTNANNEQPPQAEGLDNEVAFKAIERYSCLQIQKSMTVPEYHKNSW
jgi:hypothetical protein